MAVERDGFKLNISKSGEKSDNPIVDKMIIESDKKTLEKLQKDYPNATIKQVKSDVYEVFEYPSLILGKHFS